MDALTFTVAEAAEALGVSERTVWRYLRAERLAGETVGPPGERRTLIPAEAVAALRDARGDGPAAEALRDERDRLEAALRSAQAERDALATRVSLLQRALARPARPPLLDRLVGPLLVALARLRAPALIR
jgi:excisionase family DNA binding protein